LRVRTMSENTPEVVEIVNVYVPHTSPLGACPECTVRKPATYEIISDGERKELCGYHYGEEMDYVR